MNINDITEAISGFRNKENMENATLLTKEDIELLTQTVELDVCQRGCFSIPQWRPNSEKIKYNGEIEKKMFEFEMIKNDNGEEFSKAVRFKWELLHGVNKQVMKIACKKAINDAKTQCKVYNKYVGKKDIYAIHIKIDDYDLQMKNGESVEKQPWFIDKTKDVLDNKSYTIYAKIK